jgi:hypothetical protein
VTVLCESGGIVSLPELSASTLCGSELRRVLGVLRRCLLRHFSTGAKQTQHVLAALQLQATGE